MSLVAEHMELEVDTVKHLDDVSFEMNPGRLYTVIGRTLAGKTTLLRAIAGLQNVDSGTLTSAGNDITRRPIWRRDTAMVYQQFINYPHLDVFENVAFPLRRARLEPSLVNRRTREYLEKVGLSGFSKRKPSELSGGQQQRVALARALARESSILLLDEPLVNLDYKLREQLRDEFKNLFSDQGEAVVVYTTTEPSEGLMLGDQVIVMHEGRFVQTGAPAEVYDNPRSITVTQIVDDPPMNIFSGRLEDGHLALQGGQSLPLGTHLSTLPERTYQFGVRAANIRPGTDHAFGGDITFVEVSGSETFVHVQTDAGSFVMRIEGIHDFVMGERLPVEVDVDRLFVFDMDGLLVASPGR